MIFTDRSRYKAFFQCQMERFLNYHIFGKGIVIKGSAIPLATGSHAHKAVEHILSYCLEGNLPTSAQVRDAIQLVTSDYENEVAESGFLEVDDETRSLYIVAEQTTLISGMIWAWATYVLPEFLENFQILHIEQEMERIVGCSCGLSGVGTVEDHIKRDCNGVCIMTRPDIVAKDLRTDSDELAYIELKTGGKIDSDTFDGDVQFAFGAAGIEGYTGQKLSASYVHGLVKGYRVKSFNPESGKKDGPKKQQSSLCYAYVKPGIDGLVPEDVKFKYGKGVSKAHKKTPVWEMSFKGIGEGIPLIEHYISLMSDEELESHVRVFGPFPYPQQQVEETLKDIEHVERRNAETFAFVNDQMLLDGFGSEHVEEALHEHIPKSWACRRWGYQMCPYYSICMKQSGWEDPCKYMDYNERQPNHPVEYEFEV